MKFRTTIRKEGSTDEVRVIEAPTRFAVYEIVKGEGGIVASISPLGGLSLDSLSRLNISIGTGIKRVEIVHLAKNLSAMLSAGLSLSRALSVIERQSSNKHLKAIVTGLSEGVKGGSSFHEALAMYPKVFSELFVAMVRAGEESGSLSESLVTVGVQMEHSEELVRKIKGAMIYPAIVITAILIVAVLMLIYVVPTLTNTFTELKVKIPMATQLIVVVSNFMVAHSLLVLVGIIALVGGGMLFVRSKTGGTVVLLAALHLPVVNELVRETYAARAARTLSSLLGSGVPVLDALVITREVVHAHVFANVIAEAEEHVRKGEPLSVSFAEYPKLYPILMSDMLAVGEETGNVTNMLKQVAEFYEADVSEKTKDLSTIIEPVLMLIIGVCVGFFAVAMIAPIYSLSSAF